MESMKIWFHEPWQGFQVDYFEGFWRGILKENLESTSFLTVAGKPA
jgi:hypothetical protein